MKQSVRIERRCENGAEIEMKEGAKRAKEEALYML